MNTLIFFLAQTKSAATIEILSLLLVAAIIGYVTAWLYYKSIYKKRIKAVESDKNELNNRIVNLDADIVNLKNSLGEKEIEIEQLTMEAKVLVHIAQQKHLLNYKSFGTATESEKDDLKMISNFNEEDVHAVTEVLEIIPGRIERMRKLKQFMPEALKFYTPGN